MIALALCTISCATGLREVQSIGEAVIDAKSFKAAETIVAPLHTDLELLKQRLGRLERKVRKLSRRIRRKKQKPDTIRLLKETRRSKMWN